MTKISKILFVLLAAAVLFLGAAMVMNVSADNANNDSLANAEVVTAGSPISGSLDNSEDTDDYYKVSIDAGKIIDVSFTPSSTTPMYLWFGDTNGNKIFEINSKGGIETSQTFYLAHDSPAGFYYVRVYYTDGSYSFKVTLSDQDDAASGGDAPTDVIDALEISPDTEISGELMDWDVVDMYKIWIDSGKIIKATFTPSSLTAMYLWIGNTDANKAFEINSKGGILATEKYYTANETEAGFWYFKVYYTDGTYIFNIELTDQNDGGSGHDVGPDMLTSFEADANVEYSGHLYDLDNIDHYKVWIKHQASVGISFSAATTGNMYIWVGDTEGDKVFELSSTGGIEDVVPTVSERPSGFWWVKVYYAEGSYAFKLTSSGGFDENITDDDVADDDITNLITVSITISSIEVTVEADIEVTLEEAKASEVDDFFNGSYEDQLRVQELVDLDILFEVNPKNSEEEAKEVHIEFGIKDNLPQGTKPENVKMFWLDEEEGEWVEIKDSEYDPSSGLIEADVDHLTVFAAYAKEDEEQMEDSPAFEIFLVILGCLAAFAFVSKRRR